MQRKDLLVLCFLLVFAVAPVSGHTGQAVFGYRALEPIEIDGSLSDPGWAGAASSRLSVSPANLALGKTVTGDDLAGEFSFAWDDQWLYVAMNITDPDVVANRIPFELHKQDSVQLLMDFDHNGSGYAVFTFAPDTLNGLGPWFSIPGSKMAVSYRQVGTVTRFKQVGYSVEMAVPKKALETLGGVELAAGTTIGLNVVINDADADGAWESALVWSGSKKDWHQAFAFGDLVLVEPGE